MRINIEPNKGHRYKLRCCLNCDFWKTCNLGEKRPEGAVCSYAKYGCIHYSGIYLNELPKSEENKENKDNT